MARIPLNTYSTPLAGAGQLITEPFEVANFKILSGFIGTTSPGDLFMEYLVPSTVPDTWVVVKSFPVASTIQFYEFAIGTRMRFRYTNGAIAQSSFSMAIFAEYL
jgi:hypothetical protein